MDDLRDRQRGCRFGDFGPSTPRPPPAESQIPSLSPAQPLPPPLTGAYDRRFERPEHIE